MFTCTIIFTQLLAEAIPVRDEWAKDIAMFKVL
jgi:hypothetical protein